MKKCMGPCKLLKDESWFGKNKSTKDGLSNECVECRKAMDIEYYDRNKVRINKKAKQHYRRNKHDERFMNKLRKNNRKSKKKLKNTERVKAQRKKDGKLYYLKHKENRIKYANQYYNKYKDDKEFKRENKKGRARYIAEKQSKIIELRNYINAKYKNQPCIECKSIFEPCVMDFDHIFGEKQANISFLIKNLISIDIIEQEIAKCELICARCHRLRTFTRRGDLKKKRKHKERQINMVNELKFDSCIICNISFDPCQMDFDHIDLETKIAGISTMVNCGKYNDEEVLDEILKCNLICANCHRIKTFSEKIGK